MTIYIDVILIENVIMNGIILYATAVIYKAKVKIWRLVISSIIGATFSALSYLQLWNSNIVLKLLLSIGMVYIAFNAKGLKALIIQLVTFFLTTFVFGGIAISLLYIIKPQEILIKNGIYIGTYPLKIVFLGAIIGFLIIKITFKALKGKLAKKELLCKVSIRFEEKIVDVIAMIDTGNMLKDPITGADVVVVEKNSLIGYIPEKIIDNMELILKGEYGGDFEVYQPRIRAIPFSSLGKQNGMLLGIKPDEIIIQKGEETIKSSNVVCRYI